MGFTWDHVSFAFNEAGLTIPETFSSMREWNPYPWQDVKHIWEAFWEAEDHYEIAERALALASVDPPPFSTFKSFAKLPSGTSSLVKITVAFADEL